MKLMCSQSGRYPDQMPSARRLRGRHASLMYVQYRDGCAVTRVLPREAGINELKKIESEAGRRN